MNRFIAAIDAKGGVADDSGIPWQGRIPSDARYFVEQTSTGVVLMGYRTYEELAAPVGTVPNFVLVRPGSSRSLRAGFDAVVDTDAFFDHHSGDTVWVIGGAGVFAQTISDADELYITQLQGDFRCTKFFPSFSGEFRLVEAQPPLSEGGIQFRFEIWTRRDVDR